MRFALIAALAFVVPSAFAQRGSVSPPIVNNSNILRPGVPPGGAAGAGPRTNFRGGVRRPYGGGGYGGGAVLIPYPAYVDPFYGYGSAYGPAGEPGYPVQGYSGYYDPQQQAPTIIINQNFQAEPLHPQIRDYSNVPLPEPGVTIVPPAPGVPPAPPSPPTPPAAAMRAGTPDDERPNLVLIGLKDQSVLAAIAYWVQGDTVNYVTTNGVVNRVSLSLVDRDLSRKLNAGGPIPFTLPPPR
jgi:hypothetical protein